MGDKLSARPTRLFSSAVFWCFTTLSCRSCKISSPALKSQQSASFCPSTTCTRHWWCMSFASSHYQRKSVSLSSSITTIKNRSGILVALHVCQALSKSNLLISMVVCKIKRISHDIRLKMQRDGKKVSGFSWKIYIWNCPCHKLQRRRYFCRLRKQVFSHFSKNSFHTGRPFKLLAKRSFPVQKFDGNVSAF